MYKALISFSGIISMAEGDVANITDDAVVKDLLRAGYIEEIKDNVKPEALEEVKPKKAVKKTTKKR